MTVFLGIDIGTTEVKFKLIEEEKTITSLNLAVKTYYEKNAVYQKPEEIFELIKTGMKQISNENKKLTKIGFSTAMHTIIPVFKDNTETKMYIWADNQASQVIEVFKKTDKSKEFYQKTGTPIHAMSPFAKILFFKNNQPEFYEKVAYWQDLKAYLFLKLTGNNVTDFSNATATGLFNSLEFSWDKDILAFLNIKESQLPYCLNPKTDFDLLEEHFELVNNHNVRLLLGSSDGCLAAFSAYKRYDSSTTLTLGTSGAVRKVSSKRELKSDGQQFCYYITDNLWVIGGATNNGGKVLEWLQNSFYNGNVDVYSSLTAHLNQQESDLDVSSSPLFIPYIQGERAPVWSSEVTGELVNLSIHHKQGDVIIAVAEGIIFNLKCIYDMFGKEDISAPITLNGGVFKTKEMIQLVANIFEERVCLVDNAEPVDGLFCLNETFKKRANSFKIFKPNQNRGRYYQDKYQFFLNKIADY